MSSVTAWPAPAATGPVQARLRVPGSKSLTNRALVLAALAERPSRILAPLRSRDTLLMAAALRGLGATIRDDDTDWHLTPALARGGEPIVLDCGNAGTVARFVPPLAALTDRVVTFTGDPWMAHRPLQPLLAGLRAVGAQVTGNAVPMTVHGHGRVPGGRADIDSSESSQFVSGLLLSAARFEGGLDLHHHGPGVPSAIQIEMTVRMLTESGVTVASTGSEHWQVEPGPMAAVDRLIEPDLSTASAYLAAAAATGGLVTVLGWPADSLQPGRLLPDLLTRVGAAVSWSPEGLTVRGPDRLEGIEADLHDYGEIVPTLTALAVLARTPSRLTGVAHLRHQETDRLAALASQLGALGAHIEVLEDGLAITPAPLSATGAPVLDPQADHRLAMAYAVVGLAVPGVAVADIDTTAKTVPGFARSWTELVTGEASG